MRNAYTYNIQLQRTQQTAHSACSVYYVVNISGTAESGYSCIGTNAMSQARRPFTLENLWFHNNRRHEIYSDFWQYLVCKSTVSQLDHDRASCTIGRWFESRLETLCVFFFFSFQRSFSCNFTHLAYFTQFEQTCVPYCEALFFLGTVSILSPCG